jgi:hypothetical protein
MFATTLVIELPHPIDSDIVTYGNNIVDEKYQQIWTFLKASVESATILNIVEESFDTTSDDITTITERFLSDTLESAQQFQNSTDFQQVFVQLWQSHGATVSVTTDPDAMVDSGDMYSSSYELVSMSEPNVMWQTQFPYSD